MPDAAVTTFAENTRHLGASTVQAAPVTSFDSERSLHTSNPLPSRDDMLHSLRGQKRLRPSAGDGGAGGALADPRANPRRLRWYVRAHGDLGQRVLRVRRTA
jgi:hypothetical protein